MENIQGFIALNSYALLLILFISVVFYSKKKITLCRRQYLFLFIDSDDIDNY